MTPADTTSNAADPSFPSEDEALARTTRTVPMAQRGRFDQPRWVMMRSLIVPGWGQAYNKAWLKAAGVAVGELALAKAIVNDERELSQLSDKINSAQADGDELAYSQGVAEYNALLSDSIGRRWLLGTLIAFALADAYVDAHFTHFDVEFGADKDKSSRPRGRVSLRWTF